jgi:predicted O-methyltransferase YrrM
MEHFHYKVPGWFTFPKLYHYMVQYYNDAHFVEIGAWQGSSTAFMAVEIINSGKNIKFDIVDSWNRFAIDGLHVLNPELFPDDYVYQLFLENMKPVQHVINPIRMDSATAAVNYKDESLDFIFIDADHSYEAVTRDLQAWFPKLKKNGHIAGHDYVDDERVYKAVRDFFNIDDTAFCGENCWCYYKR